MSEIKSEIFYQYYRGESIPSQQFNNPEGLKLFGSYVWEDHKTDQAIAQQDLWGEYHWQKANPIELEPEKVHLMRYPDTREGRRQQESFDLSRATELQKIGEYTYRLEMGDHE